MKKIKQSEVNELRDKFMVKKDTEEVLGEILTHANTTNGKKICLLDIETDIADDAEDFMPDFELQKPEIKQPKYKKDGELYANSKSVAEQEADWEYQKAYLYQTWKEQCPLNPTTAKIIFLSVLYPNGESLYLASDEKDLLRIIWNVYSSCQQNNWILVGHNIKKFDLPMAVRRSWKHKIKPLYDGLNTPPWESKWIVDTMSLWNQGVYGEKFISLDNLAHYLGFSKKAGKSKDFAKMLNTDYQKAIEYVTSEMNSLRNIANVLL